MISEQPKVTVVVPFYNTEKFLPEALNSLLAQTFTDFEIICVDDESTDRSAQIVREYMHNDARIRLLAQKNKGAGAARNLGLAHARGEFLYFFDADDLCAPRLLELTVQRAQETGADIVAFEFERFFPDGTRRKGKGVNRDWLPDGIEVFSYRDCPDRIMNVVNPTPWNKLYRTTFVQEHHLQFDEISSTNDVTFAGISVAAAQSIAILPDRLLFYRVGESGTITSGKMHRMGNVAVAVDSALRQASALENYEDIKIAVVYFALEMYLFALYHYVTDLSISGVRSYYEKIRAVFCTDRFDYEREQIGNDLLYNRFLIVRKYDYDSFCRHYTKRVIVSMTSCPTRIDRVHEVLLNVFQQTHPADEVLLWLAESEFSGREADLPDELLRLSRDGLVNIRWCRDLKPHKKYYYAFKEYSEDLVVTLDDDVLYPKGTLERLFDSYLLWPEAVSANQVHLMAVTEEKELMPYAYWVKGTDACLYEPSMQLFASGAGGVLYPAGLFADSLPEETLIEQTGLYADDVWLKALELLRDVPVVLAQPYRPLYLVPGSQKETLGSVQAQRETNDQALQNIIARIDEEHGEGFFVKKLCDTSIGRRLIGIEAICLHFARELAGHAKKEQFDLQMTERLLENTQQINQKVKKIGKICVKLDKRIHRFSSETQSLEKSLHKLHTEISQQEREITALQNQSEQI